MKLSPLFLLAIFCATALSTPSPSLALFTKTMDTWVPLRAKKDIMLTYFSISSMNLPIAKFSVVNGYLAMAHPGFPHYIGFYAGKLGLGPGFIKNHFTVDKDGMITNQAFYDCTNENVDVILKVSSGTCVKLNIYVMPIDQKTNLPKKNVPENFVKNLLLSSAKVVDETEDTEAAN